MKKDYSPFEDTDENVLELYSNILSMDKKGLKRFLFAVKNLETRIPDMVFNRLITEEEGRLLNGFKDENFQTYIPELMEVVRERLNTHLDNRDPNETKYYQIKHHISKKIELQFCRGEAIRNTIEKIIPDIKIRRETFEIPICYNRNGPRLEP